MNIKLKLLLSNINGDRQIAFALIKKDKEFQTALYHVVRYIDHRYSPNLPRYFKGLRKKLIAEKWKQSPFIHDTYYKEMRFAMEIFDRHKTEGVFYEKAKEGLKIIMKE